MEPWREKRERECLCNYNKFVLQFHRRTPIPAFLPAHNAIQWINTLLNTNYTWNLNKSVPSLASHHPGKQKAVLKDEINTQCITFFFAKQILIFIFALSLCFEASHLLEQLLMLRHTVTHYCFVTHYPLRQLTNTHDWLVSKWLTGEKRILLYRPPFIPVLLPSLLNLNITYVYYNKLPSFIIYLFFYYLFQYIFQVYSIYLYTEFEPSWKTIFYHTTSQISWYLWYLSLVKWKKKNLFIIFF